MIRKAKLTDLDAIRQLFYNTITTVNTKDYTPRQIEVWASGYADIDRWKAKLNSQQFFVYEEANTICAFTSLKGIDYIDHLYVSQHHLGKGIATKLLTFIETEAIRKGAEVIKSDVSITARPFFEAKGYSVINQNHIPKDGEILINFDVIKEV